MLSTDWQYITASGRHMARQMMRGTRKSIVKKLAEFITNADDSYFRLEQKGTFVDSVIKIGYWKRPKEKGKNYRVIRGFVIFDKAEGIDSEVASKAFGPKSYGEDTSRSARRGCIGQGAKDAFYEMDKCHILSVKDKVPIIIPLRTDKREGLLQSRQLDPESSHEGIEVFQKKVEGKLDHLPVDYNWTVVYFEIPSSFSSPREDTIKEGLTSYYMLRKILSDPKRKVELTDLDTGKKTRVFYKPPPIDKELLQKDFEINYNGIKIPIAVSIFRAKKNLMQEGERREGGLLIVDEDDAVLDLTLFGFDDQPAASRLFGEVRIGKFKQLYRLDPTLITDNRDGLDYNNKFNAELKRKIIEILKDVIQKEENQLRSTTARVDKKFDKKIKNALQKINKLIRRDTRVLRKLEEEEYEELPPDGIAFSPQETTIIVGETKEVKLLINPEKVPPNSAIKLNCKEPTIIIDPPDTVFTPASYSEEIPTCKILIKCEKAPQETIIEARYGELEPANLSVRVIDEKQLSPPNGFAFMPDRISAIQNKERKVRLIVDKNVVPPSTVVKIKSDNPKIEVIENNEVRVPPSQGTSLAIITVKIKGKEAGEKGLITADAGERKALVEVKIVEARPPTGLFSDYKLDEHADKRQRFSCDRMKGIIHVHTQAPVLKKYFGEKCENLKNDPRAQVLLCETILNCICFEWSRFRIERGLEEVLGSEEIEVQRIARKIEFTYGEGIHDWIIGTLKQ